ncbi:MAG: alpha/beta hydrolase [Solirubrobacteraceae bacterium]|jgi:pimeloyl-ACP methyl ester carboxylesterase
MAAPVTPRVALLPGAGGAGAFWQPVADRLPADWSRMCFSWPGAGDQAPDPAVRGYRDLIGWTAGALQDGTDLVAQSMGGVVALGIALAHPAKVRRLVLVATSGGTAVDPHGAEDWRREYRREFPGAATWVTSERIDFGDTIASIAAPACLIWGDADPLSPVAVGRRLQRLLPASTLHVLADATHTLARDRPDAVATLIAEHLRQPEKTQTRL